LKEKKVPMRKCIGCGEMKPKRELVRVVKAPDTKNENGEITERGELSLDLIGKKPGRGAYVCKNSECFEKAVKAKRFERAFKGQIPQSIFDGIKEELKGFE
jgi:predicted RNA-binding protein YlxR (DUF448 family)